MIGLAAAGDADATAGTVHSWKGPPCCTGAKNAIVLPSGENAGAAAICPVTRTDFPLHGDSADANSDILERVLIIRVLPDIAPVFADRKANHPPACGEQALDQVISFWH